MILSYTSTGHKLSIIKLRKYLIYNSVKASQIIIYDRSV